MYTDGLIERRGLDVDVGIDLLGELLLDDDQTPDRLVTRIGQVIGASDDDAALLLADLEIQRFGLELESPAEPASLREIRRRLRSWLTARQVEVGDVDDIVLAVSEACNNAIEHAYQDRPGTLTLKLRADDTTIEAVVEDLGQWRETEPREERGRGIGLMHQLMDTAEFERNGTGTRVILRRCRQPIDQATTRC
jgi:anti-sigma regulatory factor (Ser/Thr protein kinase)